MINFSLIFSEPENPLKSREISLTPETIGGYFVDNIEKTAEDGTVTQTKGLVIVMKEFDAARSQFAEITKYKTVTIHGKPSQKPYLEIVEVPQHLMYPVRAEEFDAVLEQLKSL